MVIEHKMEDRKIAYCSIGNFAYFCAALTLTRPLISYDTMDAAANLHDQCIPTAVCILHLAIRNVQRNDQHTDDQIVNA